jgi:hypothetical protein
MRKVIRGNANRHNFSFWLQRDLQLKTNPFKKYYDDNNNYKKMPGAT